MKKISLLLSCLVLLFMASCKDECEGIECNGGVCVDGTCECPEGFFGDNCEVQCTNGVYQDGTCTCLAGFEGDACDVESRAKYYGSWTGTLSGCTIEIPFVGEYEIPELPITLEVSENADDIEMVNVVFGMEDGTATIDGDEIELDPVTMQFGGGGQTFDVEFSGLGELVSDTQLEMTLDIGVLGNTSECPLTLTKG